MHFANSVLWKGNDATPANGRVLLRGSGYALCFN